MDIEKVIVNNITKLFRDRLIQAYDKYGDEYVKKVITEENLETFVQMLLGKL